MRPVQRGDVGGRAWLDSAAPSHLGGETAGEGGYRACVHGLATASGKVSALTPPPPWWPGAGQSVGSGPTCYRGAMAPALAGVVLHSALAAGGRRLPGLCNTLAGSRGRLPGLCTSALAQRSLPGHCTALLAHLAASARRQLGRSTGPWTGTAC